MRGPSDAPEDPLLVVCLPALSLGPCLLSSLAADRASRSDASTLRGGAGGSGQGQVGTMRKPLPCLLVGCRQTAAALSCSGRLGVRAVWVTHGVSSQDPATARGTHLPPPSGLAGGGRAMPPQPCRAHKRQHWAAAAGRPQVMRCWALDAQPGRDGVPRSTCCWEARAAAPRHSPTRQLLGGQDGHDVE
jgi:hypothetical protein